MSLKTFSPIRLHFELMRVRTHIYDILEELKSAHNDVDDQEGNTFVKKHRSLVLNIK